MSEAEEKGPKRIQLSRAKGWRMPEGAVNVARPGKFGNPFTIVDAIESGYATTATAQAFVVECFQVVVGLGIGNVARWGERQSGNLTSRGISTRATLLKTG